MLLTNNTLHNKSIHLLIIYANNIYKYCDNNMYLFKSLLKSFFKDKYAFMDFHPIFVVIIK